MVIQKQLQQQNLIIFLNSKLPEIKVMWIIFNTTKYEYYVKTIINHIIDVHMKGREDVVWDSDVYICILN